MVKRLILSVLFGVLALALPLSVMADFQKNKVAVLDFQLQGEGFETADMGSIVAEWFITALVKTGRFDVVERAMLKKILEEQQLAMAGVVDESSATEIGKLLGVKVIISGSVLKLQNILEINARIIDVESGSIIAAENVKSKSSSNLQSLIVQMSEKIIKNFPLEGYVVQRKEATITIDLGRFAGVRQDMEFIVYREGEVIKHPKTGEVLDVTQIQTGKFRVTNVRDKIAQGVIVEEAGPGAIDYGQRVKSVAGQLLSDSSSASSYYDSSGRRTKGGKLSSLHAGYVRKIKSSDPRQRVWIAKTIVKIRLAETQVLDVMEEELLKGYKKKPLDKHHMAAMIWFVRALGTGSSKERYRKAIGKVAADAPNRKLKVYAIKILAKFY